MLSRSFKKDYNSDDAGKLVTESSGLKNKFRRRTIPIIRDTLWERLCAIPHTIFVGGKAISPENIFYSPEGMPYQPNNWANRVFRPFMKALCLSHPEIPELSPHELRHSRATLWIAQGMEPYMVARLLGQRIFLDCRRVRRPGGSTEVKPESNRRKCRIFVVQFPAQFLHWIFSTKKLRKYRKITENSMVFGDFLADDTGFEFCPNRAMRVIWCNSLHFMRISQLFTVILASRAILCIA